VSFHSDEMTKILAGIGKGSEEKRGGKAPCIAGFLLAENINESSLRRCLRCAISRQLRSQQGGTVKRWGREKGRSINRVNELLRKPPILRIPGREGVWKRGEGGRKELIGI